MNKFFGYTHLLVAFIVLLYFCLGPILGDLGSDYWPQMSWIILVTSLLAVYFCFQFKIGDATVRMRQRSFALCTTFLVVHHTLDGDLETTLWKFTVVLYVLLGTHVGRMLKAG